MSKYPKAALIIAVIVYGIIVFNMYAAYGIHGLLAGVFIPILFWLATIDWSRFRV